MFSLELILAAHQTLQRTTGIISLAGYDPIFWGGFLLSY